MRDTQIKKFENSCFNLHIIVHFKVIKILAHTNWCVFYYHKCVWVELFVCQITLNNMKFIDFDSLDSSFNKDNFFASLRGFQLGHL